MNFYDLPDIYFILFRLGMAANEANDSKFIDFMIQMTASLIGVGGALYVYYHGNKISKEKADKEQDRLEKDRLRYLFHLISGSKGYLEFLIESYSKFIESIETNPTIFPNIGTKHGNNVDRFVNKINQEEHYHAYRNQKLGNTNITTIFNEIDFIHSIQTEFTNKYTSLQNLFESEVKKFANATQVCHDLLFTELKLLEETKMRSTPLFKHLNACLKRFEETYNKQDLTLIDEQFLIQLSEVLIYHRLAQQSGKYHDIYAAAQIASSLLNNVKELMLFGVENYKADLINLNNCHISLLENMIPLRNFVEKNNFHIAKTNIKPTSPVVENVMPE